MTDTPKPAADVAARCRWAKAKDGEGADCVTHGGKTCADEVDLSMSCEMRVGGLLRERDEAREMVQAAWLARDRADAKRDDALRRIAAVEKALEPNFPAHYGKRIQTALGYMEGRALGTESGVS